MFEPCSRKELEREPELLRYVDVLKFSSDQIEFGAAWLDELPTLLQVCTSGESGLSYRRSGRDWHHLVAIPAERVADPAGAGDWCSAALIDGLGRHGAAGVAEASDLEIVRVLQRGQRFAAANCAYHGARGLMSSVEFWREFQCVNSSDTSAARLAKNPLPVGWSPASLTHPWKERMEEVWGRTPSFGFHSLSE
jgi:fructokinase